MATAVRARGASPAAPDGLAATAAPASKAQGGLAVAAVVAAVLPILVATVRAIRDDWLAVGDNAFFAVRALDVGTRHHPLLGTWTSASVAAGVDVNNPGPLFFEVLALPARLFGGADGLAIGAAALNALAVVTIAVLAHRRGGPLLVAGAMVPTAVLLWTMGSELLFDPWQPHSLLVPFLCLLVLVWSLACGDLLALPVAVLVASLLLQTHLTYAVLIPLLAAWGLVGLVLALRRERALDPGAWPDARRRVVRSTAVATLVLAACWAQPLYEQVAGEGEGNLSRLVRSTEAEVDTVGLGAGARVVATVVASPPWILRPSFRETFAVGDPDEAVFGLGGVPSPAGAALGLGVLVAVLAACAWDARRRSDLAGGRLAVTALLALAGAVATVAQAPLGSLGLAPHQVRWLWPVGAFLALTVVLATARRLAASGVRALPVVGVLALLTAGVAAANLPTFNQGAGPSADERAIPVVAQLGRQLDVLEGGGPVLIDLAGIRFAEPYTLAVMAELQRRGIEFVVPADDEVMIRQLGPTRRFDGTNAERLLLVREGEAVRTPPPGTERVALVEGLGEAERAEVVALTGTVTARLGEQPLRLNRAGLDAVASGTVADPDGLAPDALVSTRLLFALAERDLLDVDAGLRADLDRLGGLVSRADVETVAVFVGPLSARP